MKILHIDSSVLGGNSISRKISAAVMEKARSAFPDASVTYRDLATDPVPHLSGAYLAAAQGMTADHEPAVQADLAIGASVMEEYLAADIVVLGAALYNLTVSTLLKAWIDRIVIVGKTFRYTPEGAQIGLMNKQRVILCVSRGGIYSEGSPGAAIEHCETYLRAVMNFMAVGQIDSVVADGVAIGPEHLKDAMTKMTEQVAALSF